MKSTKIMTAVAVVALTLSGASMANAADAMKSHKTSRTTSGFIKDASAGGMFEVDSSKIALEKSQDAKVKDFAQKMVDDHSKANDELKSTLAENQTKFLSKKENMMQMKTLDKLNKDDAANFDKDYIDAQVKAHDQTIALFSKYSKKGDDADLKSFAAKTLPTLQHHKEMVDEMHAAMMK